MKLVKPSYEIITPFIGEDILKQIELAARTCYKSEHRIDYGSLRYYNKEFDQYINTHYAKSARLLVKKLIESGHHAMLEFGGMITVKFVCDRGVSHELVRHRIASFAQESTRYCNYSKDKFDNNVTFIIPTWCTLQERTWTREQISTANPSAFENEVRIWLYAMERSETSYIHLLNSGWQPQQARSVLPNSLKTEINVSANIREWREIFKQRTSNAAHPQMLELMRPLLKEFQDRLPILFDDINY